ncbi:uncharacterized protein EV422DRAFT_540160 [Fimicolochytrium jonesii]|uniref:uncharacterized protein n=1 Tax=Fimicolochytrium jonesii TaxID=1396493 RepID=UPI0022FDFED1|nr:uncharacterized protein EV422DRAFT_540160 [Fimicolochytrium jonesii]KAI8817842.1 hypothetical protein EV422DRAFT_540160 [Fimicolochytrium jonesii]
MAFRLGLLSAALSIPVLYSGGPKFVAPVYGQFLSEQHHFEAALGSVVLGAALGYAFTSVRATAESKARPHTVISLLVSLLLTAAPGVMRTLFSHSREWGPEWGPLLTMAPVYAAIALLSAVAVLATPALNPFMEATAVSAALISSLRRADAIVDKIGEFTGGSSTCGFLRFLSFFWLSQTAVDALMAGMSTSPAVVATTDAKNDGKKPGKAAKAAKALAKTPQASAAKNRLFSMGALIVLSTGTVFLGSLFPESRQCSASVKLDNKYELLALNESVTGYLYVIQDNSKHGGMRLMRCDHSLIGGGYPEYDFDSVFGSFYFLDFVQYITSGRASATTTRKALQIGLGVGASTKTLLEHARVSLDLVELDPLVVEYAKTYFALPEPATTHIGDGRAFIDDAPDNTYDFVIHDVFTGGVVPGKLFTVEAIRGVKRVLKPKGVLALNFVGTLESIATKSVVSTLKDVFPYLEIYTEDKLENLAESPLYNMVFYASTHPITFTIPETATLPHTSHMYRHFVDRFPASRATDSPVFEEMVGNLDERLIITDKHNPLATLQIESAEKHWGVMRKLFDDEFWTGF